MSEIQLGRMQFRIMQVLWDRGRANAREITDALNESEPVAHSTVQTLLRQLEDGRAEVGHDAGNRSSCSSPRVEGRQGQEDRDSRAAGTCVRRQRGQPGGAPLEERAHIGGGTSSTNFID